MNPQTPRFARLAFPGTEEFSWYRIDGENASPLAAAPWVSTKSAGPARSVQDAIFGVPTIPSKIICVGRNYAAHAKELGNEVPKEPLLFHKPPSSLIATGGTVVIPRESERVEQEAELAFVVGKRVRRASREEARAAIFGYTLAFDITARDLQKKDVQFTRGKGFDTFCPVGPTLVAASDFSPDDTELRCFWNDTLRQHGHTRDMVFPVDVVLAYASAVMTFEPGDLVLTGTPEGVGPLGHGDTLRMEIPGLDSLSVQVVREA
jgi:2-keto-4-pentenoate hydratase/2-oxohepta-3-ene-1,7-dioic acid hydratase in catechol pathway